MFLDSPKSFTLSRAIQYLSGDAETPRQYLMAGSVIVTLPVLFIFEDLLFLSEIICILLILMVPSARLELALRKRQGF